MEGRAPRAGGIRDEEEVNAGGDSVAAAVVAYWRLMKEELIAVQSLPVSCK